jgi:hypothetical protein
MVSIEVSPYLAMETDATISEAKRLWGEDDRKNLMIKVPATEAGLPAIRALTAEGINVNITLLCAQGIYERAVEAYGREWRRRRAHCQRGELFRQSHRQRGGQAARRQNRRSERSR